MSSDEGKLLERALAGDGVAARQLIALLLPVVKARVARLLGRRGTRSSRPVDQDLGDMCQEVFVVLFADGARVLRQWNPDRGASLLNFVGLVAEREVISILRSRRRSPFTEDPTETDELDSMSDPSPAGETRALVRDELERVLDELRLRLSPEGLHLFYVLVVEERDIDTLSKELGLERNTLYVRRSRLRKLVHRIREELELESSSSGQVPEPVRVCRQGKGK